MKKPHSISHDLNAFVVRITKDYATLESASKNWKTVFRNDTKQFVFIISLYKDEEWDILETMARCIYCCGVFGATDPKFIIELSPLLVNAADRIQNSAEQISSKEDAEILEQERLKQEHQDANTKN